MHERVLQSISNTFLFLKDGKHSLKDEVVVLAQKLTSNIVNRVQELLRDDETDYQKAQSVKETSSKMKTKARASSVKISKENDKETNLLCFLRRLRALFEKIDVSSSLPANLYSALHTVISRRTEDGLHLRSYREDPHSGVVVQSLSILATTLGHEVYTLQRLLEDQSDSVGVTGGDDNEEMKETDELDEARLIVESLGSYRDNISNRLCSIMAIDSSDCQSIKEINLIRAYKLQAYSIGFDMRSLFSEAASNGSGPYQKDSTYNEKGFIYPLKSLQYDMPPTLIRDCHRFFNEEMVTGRERNAKLLLRKERKKKGDTFAEKMAKAERNTALLRLSDSEISKTVFPLFPALARVLNSNPKAKREAAVLVSLINESGKTGSGIVNDCTKTLQRRVGGKESYLKVQMAALRHTYRQLQTLAETGSDEDEDSDNEESSSASKVYQAYTNLLSLASRLSSFYGVGTVPVNLRVAWEDHILSGVKFAFQQLPNQLGFLDVMDYYVRKLPKAAKSSVLKKFELLADEMGVIKAARENQLKVRAQGNHSDDEDDDDDDVSESMWAAYTAFRDRLEEDCQTNKRKRGGVVTKESLHKNGESQQNIRPSKISRRSTDGSRISRENNDTEFAINNLSDDESDNGFGIESKSASARLIEAVDSDVSDFDNSIDHEFGNSMSNNRRKRQKTLKPELSFAKHRRHSTHRSSYDTSSASLKSGQKRSAVDIDSDDSSVNEGDYDGLPEPVMSQEF